MTDTTKAAALQTLSDMGQADEIEWPREIWMAEREEHDQGVVYAVLSQHATVARFPGDKERDRDFHHYVDADIYDSNEKYRIAQIEALASERDALAVRVAELEGERERLWLALATDAAEAVGQLKSHDPEEGKRLWRSIRAALTTDSKGSKQ